MATPLEDQILRGFRLRLEEATAVPNELVDALVSLAGGTSAPSPHALLGAIKSKTGEQSV
jgi:hypothetical protein